MSAFTFDQQALNRMYRYCCALTCDDSAAFDLLQDGIERYLRRQAVRGDADNPEALLRRILRNRFIDNHRTDHRDIYQQLDDNSGQQRSLGLHGLDDLLIAQEDLELVWAELSPLERELLHLWAVEGYTAQEIAIALDEPRGTVLSRIHRLRRRLERWRSVDRTVCEVLT